MTRLYKLMLLVVLLSILIVVLSMFKTQLSDEKRVYDDAKLFSKEDVSWINQFHGKLSEEYDIDYRIMTKNVTGNLSFFANKTFKKKNVGSMSKAGRGMLLVIDPVHDSVRLEVSGSLEHIYTDSFVAYIQTRQMVPFFTENRVADGVLAMSEFIFKRAKNATAGEDFLPPTKSFSAGGGAKRSALIGKGKGALPKYRSRTTVIPKGELTPLDVIDLYNRSMRNRDANFMKRIYTDASQAMMKKMVVTPAQMDSAIKNYIKCGQGQPYMLENFAVVKYNIEPRECFPYFLLRDADGQWKLDFVTMGKVIRFNHNNDWHFVPRHPPKPYAFAFGDSVFDKNGYRHAYSQAWLKSFRWQISYFTMPSGNTFVTWVGKNSPAKMMGFQYADQLVSWMGKTGLSQRSIIPAMNLAKPGEKIWATVNRANRPIRLDSIAPPNR